MTTSVLWLGAQPLVLASGSATRRLLLDSAGIPVRVCPAVLDERAIEAPLTAAGAAFDTVALALARAKSLAVSAGQPGRLVLGADQTLSLDGRALHKPDSIASARHQIAALAGRRHALHAAFALSRDGTLLVEGVETATLTMRDLSAGFIDRYIEAAGPDVCDSVGGYKLEGFGIHLFERIEGDQATILGLPLLPVLHALRKLGFVAD